MSISNRHNFEEHVDSYRIDHNIRHYLQVFENEIKRKIQESEDRIRKEIEQSSLSKMDQIIELVSQVQIRHFEATVEYKKQAEIVEQINSELKALRMDLEVEKKLALQKTPINVGEASWREVQQIGSPPSLKRPRCSTPLENESFDIPNDGFRNCPTRFITTDPRTNEAAFKIQVSSRHKCIYCRFGHFSDECPIVSDSCQRKEVLRNQNRCFRCCGQLDNHVSCQNKECRYCKVIGKTRIDHHSSICRVPINFYYSSEK